MFHVQKEKLPTLLCNKLTFNLKTRLGGNVKDMSSNVGAGGDEIHGTLFILVPH